MLNRVLTEFSFEIFNFKCFDDSGSGKINFDPINIIIGRNNAGKSAIVDFVDVFLSKSQIHDPSKHNHNGNATSYDMSWKITENELNPIFREDTSQGGLPGNHWTFGSKYIGAMITLRDGQSSNRHLVSLENLPNYHTDLHTKASKMVEDVAPPLNGLQMTRVAAERDIRAEPTGSPSNISPNGVGLTTAVWKQINHTSSQREVIEEKVLNDLNEIYRGDSEFTEILTRIDDNNYWEIYIREKGKGDIRLSESGSGLKTALMISTLIRLRPEIQWKKQIFAIDEPENNLHPALFRRLLEYLAQVRQQFGFVLLITTHSSVAIDWAARRDDSKVIHVTNDGTRAKAAIADGYLASRDVLDDLGFRASDILQANGIIWVEGPSDRIYLRRWLDLYSGGKLKEGVHYNIMFYGGKLLSHLDGAAPEIQPELIPLLTMNRNSAILMDSDIRPIEVTDKDKIRNPRSEINATKQRVEKEFTDHGGMAWITQGREVENYIPIKIYATLVSQVAPTITEFDSVINLPILQSFKQDKIKLAHAVCSSLKRGDLANLDLERQLEELTKRIRGWNGILA